MKDRFAWQLDLLVAMDLWQAPTNPSPWHTFGPVLPSLMSGDCVCRSLWGCALQTEQLGIQEYPALHPPHPRSGVQVAVPRHRPRHTKGVSWIQQWPVQAVMIPGSSAKNWRGHVQVLAPPAPLVLCPPPPKRRLEGADASLCEFLDLESTNQQTNSTSYIPPG